MSETKVNEKKVVGRNVVIALGIICIVLIAGLAGILVILNGANSQITSLHNQNQQLQVWLEGNETLLNQTNDQVTSLLNQIASFQNTPFILGFSNLTAEDNRTIPDRPFLQIEGTVRNFGIYGQLAIVYVEAYHSDGSAALEKSTDFSIGKLSSINVDLNCYYNGSSLASWTISVEGIVYI